MKDAATRGCVAVIEIPGMWGRDQVEEVVQSMTEIVSKGGDGEVR
jgi:DNA repair/transcription protein MET18/MMS19